MATALPIAAAPGPTKEEPEEPATPDVLVIDARPAVARWRSSDGTWNVFQHSRLEVSHNAAQNTAHLKLYTAITFRALPTRTKLGLILFVDPERVRSISLDENTDTADTPGELDVRAALGTTAWCLHVDLAWPADLIVPTLDLTPRSKAGTEALAGLRDLAQSTRFDVLLSHKAATKAQLARVCGVFRTCTRDPEQPQLASLYHGKGAVVLDPTALAAVDQEHGNPPSYEESGVGPPMPPWDSSSRPEKRRRLSDSPGTSQPGPSEVSLEAVCRKVLEESRASWKAEIREELREELREHATRTVDERIAALRDQMTASVTSVTATMAAVREELDGLEERLTDRIDGLEGELEGHVDFEIEDMRLSLRIDLEDFVRDEIRDAERRIRERLESRTFTSCLSVDLGSDSDQ